MLERVDRWLEQWRRPIWDSIYRRDKEDCLRVLDQAEAAWIIYDESRDKRMAARLYLDSLTCEVAESFTAVRDIKRGLVLETLEQLSQPMEEPLATMMQARVLLTLRCWAHVQGIFPLDIQDVERWFNKLPPEDRDHQLMSYLALWAFTVEHAGFLEMSYHWFLTQRVLYLVAFSRQRVKVMLALIERRCARRDLCKLIDLAPHMMHLQWIGRHVAAFCQDHGLWDDELQEKLDYKIRQLRQVAPQAPPREVPEGILVNF
jgi:hypothetical protein